MRSRSLAPLALAALISCGGTSKPQVTPIAGNKAQPALELRDADASAQSETSAPEVLDAGLAADDASAIETEPAPEAGASRANGDMLLVPAGEFTMGANDVGERDEQPAHRVTIAAFWLDKLEVTNGDYEACVRANACRPYRTGVAEDMKLGPEKRFRGPTQPVVGVSWDDAKAYCKRRGKRLPTEAEWEKAARGTDGRTYPWGEADPDPLRLACFAGSKSGATLPVGSFPDGKGPYGHLDLTGNVWEWTADYYDPYAYKRPTAAQGIPGSCEEIMSALNELRAQGLQGYTGTNPIPNECEHVLRGGAFNYNSRGLRASNRVHHPARFRLVVAGFRCAESL